MSFLNLSHIVQAGTLANQRQIDFLMLLPNMI